MLIICWYKIYEGSQLDGAFRDTKKYFDSNLANWSETGMITAFLTKPIYGELNWQTMKKGRKDRGGRAVLIHPSDQFDHPQQFLQQKKVKVNSCLCHDGSDQKSRVI